MKVPRSTVDDAILAILVATLQPATGPYPGGQKFAEVSKHWQSWSTPNQPACYLKRVNEEYSQVLRGQNKYVLFYEIWIYGQFEVSSTVTDPYDTFINPVMDALDTAIDPPVGLDWQNLGNNSIANARLAGKGDIADGTVDGQIAIVMPMEVFVGSSN